MARKRSLWKRLSAGTWAGAWTGACFGIASTILVLDFGAKIFTPTLSVVAISALALDTILLIGGVVGFAVLSVAKPKKRRRR